MKALHINKFQSTSTRALQEVCYQSLSEPQNFIDFYKARNLVRDQVLHAGDLLGSPLDSAIRNLTRVETFEPGGFRRHRIAHIAPVTLAKDLRTC